MVTSRGEWSEEISQLMVVGCCCSVRRTLASGTCRALFIRAQRCWKRKSSVSIPFIRMILMWVKASSSSLLMGGCTLSFQVNRCLSRDIPRQSKSFMATMPPSVVMTGSFGNRVRVSERPFRYDSGSWGRFKRKFRLFVAENTGRGTATRGDLENEGGLTMAVRRRKQGWKYSRRPGGRRRSKRLEIRALGLRNTKPGRRSADR